MPGSDNPAIGRRGCSRKAWALGSLSWLVGMGAWKDLTVDDARFVDAEARVQFADAALALAGHEVTDPVLRELLEQVTREEISADEAVAAMRRHVQG